MTDKYYSLELSSVLKAYLLIYQTLSSIVNINMTLSLSIMSSLVIYYYFQEGN